MIVWVIAVDYIQSQQQKACATVLYQGALSVQGQRTNAHADPTQREDTLGPQSGAYTSWHSLTTGHNFAALSCCDLSISTAICGMMPVFAKEPINNTLVRTAPPATKAV